MSIKRVVNIAPSILSCDFAFLYDECKKMIDAGCDSLHVDIMDGHFVPNLTVGPPVVTWIRKHLKDVFLDCHIMVSNPADYIEPLFHSGANGITFHYEASYQNLEQLCEKIRNKNMKVGLSLSPKTQINQQIRDILKRRLVDMVLIMTVEPGFGGQKFMNNMMPKVQQLRQQFDWLDIQVDGGIDEKNIQVVAKSGANFIVSGTGIYRAQNPKATISNMKTIVEQFL